MLSSPCASLRPCSALLACGILLAVVAAPASADTLVLKDGSVLSGELLEFDGALYRFLHEDGIIRVPRAADVQSFKVERATTVRIASATEVSAASDPEAMAVELARLESRIEEVRLLVEGMGIHLDDRLNQLLTTFSSETARTQQRLYDLNPLSRVTIQNDRVTNIGKDMAIMGMIRNDSGSVLQGVKIRGELLDANGWVLTAVEHTLTHTLGANDVATFTLRFPNAPKQYANYRLTPYVDSRPSSQDTGAYFPPQPGPR